MAKRINEYQERPIEQGRVLAMYNPYRTDIDHPHTKAVKFLLKLISEEIQQNRITLKNGNSIKIQVLFWTVELETEDNYSEVFIHLRYKDLNNLSKTIIVKSIKQIAEVLNRLEAVEEYFKAYGSRNRYIDLNSKILYEIGTPQRILLGEEIFIHNKNGKEGVFYEISSEALPSLFKLKETTLKEFLEQYPYMASFLTVSKNTLLYIKVEDGEYSYRMEFCP